MSLFKNLTKRVTEPAKQTFNQTFGKLGTRNDTKSLITIGIRGSGKTAFLGCLEMACDLKSLRQPNFKHFMRERTSGMRQIASDLCLGRFPAATPPGIIYEADEIMKWEYPFGERKVIMSFCETAGEDMHNLAGKFTDSLYEQNTNWQDTETLNRFIVNANAYLMMLPVYFARIPGMPVIENPPEGLHADPDLSAARILAAVQGFKQDSGAPPIEAIGIVWTKYDLIESYCKANGMNLYTVDGSRKFMETYFRQTMGVLKYYGLDNVAFFPFHIQVKRRQLANGDVVLAKDATGGYEIATDPKRNLPLFAEQTCYNIIDWAGEKLAR